IWLTPNFHIEPFFPDDSIRPLRFHFSLANVPSLYRGQLDDPEACPSAQWVTETFNTRALRPYYFLSLNRVPRPARLCLGLWLHKMGLLDKGLISLPQVTKQRVLSRRKGFNRGLELTREPFAALFADYGSLCARLPLNIDHDFSAAKFTPLGKPNVGDFNKLSAWMYKTSYFSIVTETNFDSGPLARFTEKTWKPIISFHPILLFGSPGSVVEFRRLGFESFAPMIDERYDEISDPNHRMVCLFEEIRRLTRLTPEDLDAEYRGLWPVLQHNRRHAFTAAADEKAKLISNLAAIAAGRPSSVHGGNTL
ncbi:MAG: hypothetical protein GY798_02000, partial [Hyphomicrobiales bacterium]|nr:hypothetical protein [Hyphomicrobiales bacterium]